MALRTGSTLGSTRPARRGERIASSASVEAITP